MNERILLIDMGNTRVKWWLHHDHQPLTFDSTPASCAYRSDDFIEQLRAQFNKLNPPPTEVRITQVAKDELNTQILQLCRDLWHTTPILTLRTQRTHPLLNLNYDAAQMGSDRYAQILGAQTLLHERDHVVIGAGTALTIDGVLAGGQHIGGVIVASAPLMRAALHQYTAQLPLNEGQFLPTHAPSNTLDALSTGAQLACMGAIEQFISRYMPPRADGDAPLVLIFCGGDALELMTPMSARYACTHAPALCLLGLLHAELIGG